MNLEYKIIKINTNSKVYSSRINMIFEFRKMYNSFDETEISNSEANNIIDDILEKEKYEKLQNIDYKLMTSIQAIYSDVDYEYIADESDYCMDLGSSKYQMIEAQEIREEAEKWFEKLTDREKEYIYFFQSQNFN